MCGRDNATSVNLIFQSSEEHNNLSNGQCHVSSKCCLLNPQSFSESRKKTLKELNNNDFVKRSIFAKDSNSKRSGGAES